MDTTDDKQALDLDRRGFLRRGAIGTAAVLLAPMACGDSVTSASGAPGAPTPDAGARGKGDTAMAEAGAIDRGADLAAMPATDAGSASNDALAPTCGELTEPNIEGPFFTPNSPQRSRLREPGMTGVLLTVTGRVLGTDCKPMGGALLDFWHADSAGQYDNVGNTLRGHQFTDADGGYRLETIVPGRYLNGATYRPTHIHVKVGGTGTALLTTQLYFPGDPFNNSDAFIRPSLIMAVTDDPAGGKRAAFDFVLAQS